MSNEYGIFIYINTGCLILRIEPYSYNLNKILTFFNTISKISVDILRVSHFEFPLHYIIIFIVIYI